MPVLRRKQPSAAKSRTHYTAAMYGLKTVPFREASFSGACEAVPFVRQSLPQPLRSVKASCAVQIRQLQNLIWTSLTFSRPPSTTSGQALRGSISRWSFSRWDVSNRLLGQGTLEARLRSVEDRQ